VSAADGPGAGIAAAFSSDAVAYWLQDLGSRESDAVLMGTAHRFLRQQIVGLAKRFNAVNARQALAAQKRRYRNHMERQRSSQQMLPPNSTEAEAAPVFRVTATANSGGAGSNGRLILSPRSASAAAEVEDEDADQATAAESASNGGSGASTALSVPGSSGSTALSTVGAGGGAWRKVAKQAAPPKAHLVGHVAPSALNRHQLQDLSRTVRQLRHMQSSARCYVCKAPLFEDLLSLEAAGTNEDGTARGRARHHQFTNHCVVCGEQNAQKRHRLVDLTGRVAVLTGARIKIGFQTGIRLLRCGATLLATTRFPANALCRYRQEVDYDQWKHRLHLLYADLQNPAEVRALAQRIKQLVPHVDILINNAAQTVRRPLPYYQNLNTIEHASQVKLLQEAREQQVQFRITPHPPAHALPQPSLIAAAEQLEPAAAAELHRRAEAPDETDAVEVIAAATAAATGAPPAVPSSDSCATASSSAPAPATTSDNATALSSLLQSSDSRLSNSSSGATPALATLSLSDGSGPLELPVRHFVPFSLIPSLDDLSSAKESAAALFPPGHVDATNDHEPLDLRSGNSWNAKAEETDPRELAEVLSTNSLAPFVLCQELKEWMERSPFKKARYIILVSSMEGKLNRSKQNAHVHTNMAKAALNAFTRSVSADWAASPSCIFVNSVDTGWNSEERAVNDPKRDPTFETPLDCADGAARILDPIFTGESEQRYIFGQFLKDYAPSDW
jgi:NAD(P)-dependent dehydrogenase (short-subunit alcohol dehydrogenase family)